ncbi:MATE family multidrug resistance protein [Caulobacter rhizosphaerae]|uniref:Multidrug-efflux transporter n=1 Tax=Caulobacter rhizosphaerae TaxID=2010972 RepID=A0ABU1N0Q4_9CAUL|nr:MATE family efflux transporter [Caulobacter rhizosphaerae]MDR6531716.1 MATE family multidrug resistance protein [Caulobacter rhizosphaerae]
MSRSAAAPAPRPGKPHGVIVSDLIELLRLAGPVVLSRLGIMVMGLTDAIVVGHFSATQLGFHAMAWAPTSVFVTMTVGLLVGVQVMASRATGAGRPHETGAVLRRGVVYALWLGVAGAALLAIAGPPLMHHAGLDTALANGATAPLVVFSLSLPLFALSVTLSFWLEGLGRPGLVTVAMWIANLINLAANLLLVPGTFGLPALGAVGAAWSTFVARAAFAAMLAVVIMRLKDARAMGVFDRPAPDLAAAREQRRIGYGAGGSNLFESGAFAGMSLVAGWLGGYSVAAWAVVLNVVAVIFMVPLGLSTATAVQVGRAYGARDSKGMSRAGWVAFGVTAAFSLLVTVLLYPLRHLVAGAYTTDPAALTLIAPALALSCLFLIPDAVQVVCAQALRARGEVWIPTATHMISYALVMGPLAWWLALPMKLGVDGIVWSVIITSFLAAGLLLGRYRMLDLKER